MNLLKLKKQNMIIKCDPGKIINMRFFSNANPWVGYSDWFMQHAIMNYEMNHDIFNETSGTLARRWEGVLWNVYSKKFYLLVDEKLEEIYF